MPSDPRDELCKWCVPGIFGQTGPHGPIVNGLASTDTMPVRRRIRAAVLQLDRALVRMRLKTMMEGVETPAPTQ